jgi:hypothetical protein
MNPYDIGVGSFLVTALEVIILAFLWRALAARFITSDSPQLQKVGSAMGATL